MRSTHTYVTMPLSVNAFNEIVEKLTEAGYTHAFHKDRDGSLTVDMHGLAVVCDNVIKADDNG